MATSLKDSYLGVFPDTSGIANVPDKYYDGFIYGDLDTVMSANTYSERELVRTYNWRLFRLKFEYSKDSSGEIFFAKTGTQRVECHAPETDIMLTLESGNEITIYGNGKNSTTVAFYPFNLYSIARDWINTETYTTLNIEDVHITGNSTMKHETYQGATTASGSVLDISSLTILDSTGSTRTGWLDHIDGSKIYIRVLNDMTSNGKSGIEVKSQIRYVASHTSTTITLDTPLTDIQSMGVTYPLSDYLNVDLVIGVEFEESVSLTDFNTYGRHWVSSKYDNDFITHQPGGGNNDPSYINLNNMKCDNFDNFIIRNSGGCILSIDDSNINENIIAIGFFSSDDPTDAEIRVNQNGGTETRLEGNGVNAAGTGEYVYVTAGSILGSGGYISPNVQVTANNLICENNVAAPWRQYSATSGAIAKSGATSSYTDCQFLRNGENNGYFSREMPTTITNCTFLGAPIRNVGYKATYTNCTINSGLVCDAQGQKTSLKNPELPPYPIPASSTGDLFEVLFDNCTIVNPGFDCRWYGAAKYSTFRFNDCDFTFNSSYNETGFFGGAVGTLSTVTYKVTFTGANRIIDDGIPSGSRFLFLGADPIYELNIDASGLYFDTAAGSGNFSNVTDPINGLFQVRDSASVDGTWNAGNPTDQPYYQNVMPVVTVGDQASLQIPANINIVWWQFGDNTSITFDGAITNPNP